MDRVALISFIFPNNSTVIRVHFLLSLSLLAQLMIIIWSLQTVTKEYLLEYSTGSKARDPLVTKPESLIDPISRVHGQMPTCWHTQRACGDCMLSEQ